MDLQHRIEIRERPLWMFIPFVLVLLPLSTSLQNGAAIGAGADVVNTLWAMWWFQQELPYTAWGGESFLFNFPFGGKGAILSPIFAVCWSGLDIILGPSLASLWTSVLCLYGTMLLLVAIGRAYSWSYLSIGCMLCAFVCQRYFLFTLGETGVVGVAIFPLLLCWYAVIRFRSTQKQSWLWCIIFCIALQGLENPYLAPVPPVIVLFGLWPDKKSLGTLVVLGILSLVSIGSLYHGTSASEYQSLRPTSYAQIFGQYFPVVERTWAQLSVEEFVYPLRPRWPIGGQDTIHQAGRGFVGYSVLIFGVLGMFFAQKERWLLFFLGIWGIVFAFGSDWNGVAAPFSWFNSICSLVVRPLTQPTRYLLLTVLALSIGVGACAQRASIAKVWIGIVLWSVVLVEAVLHGGLSLRLPATEFPEYNCISQLGASNGAVLVWPWDGIDDEDFDATLHSRLFQMVHNRPGATIGTGSWPLTGSVFPGLILRDIGWTKSLEGTGRLDTKRLARWGYEWVIVDGRISKTLRTRANKEVFGEQNLVETCGEIDIYRLAKTPIEKRPTHPFANRPKPVPSLEDNF